jgi:hypothetical protein
MGPRVPPEAAAQRPPHPQRGQSTGLRQPPDVSCQGDLGDGVPVTAPPLLAGHYRRHGVVPRGGPAILKLSHYQSLDPDVDRGDYQKRVKASGNALPAHH